MSSKGIWMVIFFVLVILAGAYLVMGSIIILVGDDYIRDFMGAKYSSNKTSYLSLFGGVLFIVLGTYAIIASAKDYITKRTKMEFEEDEVRERAVQLLNEAIEQSKKKSES